MGRRPIFESRETSFGYIFLLRFLIFGPFIGREVSYYRGVQAVAAAMPPKRKPAPLALSLEADPIGDVIADRGEGTYDCPKKRLRYNAALFDSSNEPVCPLSHPRGYVTINVPRESEGNPAAVLRIVRSVLEGIFRPPPADDATGVPVTREQSSVPASVEAVEDVTIGETVTLRRDRWRTER